MYQYRHTVTIGDTNVTGNMYFEDIFKIQGRCREMWLKERVPAVREAMQSGLTLITKSASNVFLGDFHLFDDVLMRMELLALHPASAVVLFSAYQGDALKSLGKQTIVSGDRNHRPVRFPEALAAPLRELRVPEERLAGIQKMLGNGGGL